ncbi:hypothetical protein BB8028_0003g09480 [Beauveria bassiana]|uniref:Uncharacterized protein n=1 Tax=Beauveria bassiana TaxID=176275 RepID=A0A2S7Y866_BEABA|nr:hypothetical protein BB8028_0003g09480 [Beauveria bassiana]
MQFTITIRYLPSFVPVFVYALPIFLSIFVFSIFSAFPIFSISFIFFLPLPTPSLSFLIFLIRVCIHLTSSAEKRDLYCRPLDLAKCQVASRNCCMFRPWCTLANVSTLNSANERARHGLTRSHPRRQFTS